jgi:hypothetical protein
MLSGTIIDPTDWSIGNVVWANSMIDNTIFVYDTKVGHLHDSVYTK